MKDFIKNLIDNFMRELQRLYSFYTNLIPERNLKYEAVATQELITRTIISLGDLDIQEKYCKFYKFK